MSFVASSKVVLNVSYQPRVRDSVRHYLWGGLTYYFKNPLTSSAAVNPDGAVGGVIASLAAGGRFYTYAKGSFSTLWDARLMLPVSRHVTFLAGYRRYEQKEAADVVQGYGGIRIYSSTYQPDSLFLNPDGAVGSVTLHLSGGGSADGWQSQGVVMFPLQETLTLKVIFSAERVRSPYRLALTAGVGVSFYPRK